jgi:hypothetical protein
LFVPALLAVGRKIGKGTQRHSLVRQAYIAAHQSLARNSHRPNTLRQYS